MDTTTPAPGSHSSIEFLAREHLQVVAAGDMIGAARNVSKTYINHRSSDEPIDTREPGPKGFQKTIAWLHRAFTDMRFEIHAVAFNQDVAALHVTLHGRQHGPFVVHDSPDGSVTDAFPSNGRTFSARQIHWITVRDGVVVEHDAVRDDLSMAQQLGWLPPTPIFIVRMLFCKFKEARATRRGAEAS